MSSNKCADCGYLGVDHCWACAACPDQECEHWCDGRPETEDDNGAYVRARLAETQPGFSQALEAMIMKRCSCGAPDNASQEEHMAAENANYGINDYTAR